MWSWEDTAARAAATSGDRANARVDVGTQLQLAVADLDDLPVQQCRTMQKKLAAGNRTYPTIFAGDTNSYSMKCALNSSFYGLRDVEWAAKDRSSSSGFQHTYYLNAFTRSSCGELHKVTHTDHPGFLLDLHPTGKPARGKSCGVRQIR